MLDLLRRKAQSPFIQATVLIIALVFIFWGVGANRQGGSTAIAEVNDEEISYQDYQRAYDQTVNQYREQFGGSLPKGLLDSLDLENQILERLINSVLLRQGARELGIMVSDQEVQQTLREMEAFQNNGGFDLEQYRSILASSRLTPAKFEESIRAERLTDKIMGHIRRFANAPSNEVERQLIFENEEIKLRYLPLSASDYESRVEISDEKLAGYYASHTADYKTDPQIKLRYLAFPYADYQEEIEVGEPEIERYYRANLDRYTTPERRSLRHILLKADREADEETLAAKRQRLEEILDRALAGENFSELAREYSEGPSAPRGGDLGVVERGRMVKPFEDAAFALAEGEISEVVRTGFGLHLIKVEKVFPEKTRPLDEVREEIADRLRREKAKPLAHDQANRAYEQIILAGSLDKYEQKGQVPISSTDFFSRRKPPAGPEGFISQPGFLEAAFALKQGELSSLVETTLGYAVIYAAERREPQTAPLEEVREEVEKDYRLARARDLARTAAVELLDNLRRSPGGEESLLAEAAADYPATVETTGYITRGGNNDKGLPPALVEHAFTMKVSAPWPEEPFNRGDTFYVYRLLDRRTPELEKLRGDRETIKNRLLEERKINLLTAWLENMKSRADITVNRQYL